MVLRGVHNYDASRNGFCIIGPICSYGFIELFDMGRHG